MGKKILPNSLLDSNTAEKTVKEVIAEQTEFKDNSIIENGNLTSDAKEKLEKYDALEKTVAALSKDKEMLEAKIAEYAERLSNLQNHSEQISQLNGKISQLEEELSKANDSAKDEFKLKKEIEMLKEENTQHLVKISELTFDNANLTCQLEELTKQSMSKGIINNQDKLSLSKAPPTPIPTRHPHEDAYNPYKNNGYGTW